MQNTKELTTNPLKVITKFNNIVEYKFNIQNQFLHVSKEQSENDINKVTLFIVLSK